MNKAKTIRSSIRRGNGMILGGGLFLTVFFTAFLIFIAICQESAVHFSENLSIASEAIIELDTLYREIDVIVYDRTNAQTSTSLNNPSFEELCSSSAGDSQAVLNLISAAKSYYTDFKNTANEALRYNLTDNFKAQEIVDNELEADLNELTDSLHSIATTYTTMTRQATKIVDTAITISIIAGVVFLFGMLIYSLKISANMSKLIATPVVAVAEWAETLSTGAIRIVPRSRSTQSQVRPQTSPRRIPVKSMVR